MNLGVKFFMILSSVEVVFLFLPSLSLDSAGLSSDRVTMAGIGFANSFHAGTIRYDFGVVKFD